MFAKSMMRVMYKTNVLNKLNHISTSSLVKITTNINNREYDTAFKQIMACDNITSKDKRVIAANLLIAETNETSDILFAMSGGVIVTIFDAMWWLVPISWIILNKMTVLTKIERIDKYITDYTPTTDKNNDTNENDDC
jgi:uncharacterized protein (UPF0371 family)